MDAGYVAENCSGAVEEVVWAARARIAVADWTTELHDTPVTQKDNV